MAPRTKEKPAPKGRTDDDNDDETDDDDDADDVGAVDREELRSVVREVVEEVVGGRGGDDERDDDDDDDDAPKKGGAPSSADVERTAESAVRKAMKKIGAEQAHDADHEKLRGKADEHEEEEPPRVVRKLTKFLWGEGD